MPKSPPVGDGIALAPLGGMPEIISHEELVTVAGGMRWEQFRRSTNIEDRRSPAAIKRDQEYWNKSFGGAPTAPAPSDPGR